MVISRTSVFAMPTIVLIRIGNTAARTVIIIFEIEPRPKSMIINGSSAISGVA